jgi:TonB-linked SusC/RagA family outer membrane protein
MRFFSLGRPLSAAVLALAVLTANGWAQQAQRGTITGQVLDQGTQRPVVGALVQVQGTALNTITNAEGRFSLTGVPVGRWDVRVSVIGYAASSQAVTVVAGQTATLAFALAPSAIELDAVVVTGTAGRQIRRAEAAQIANVNAAEIARTAPVKSVADVLSARTPGVSVTQSSGSSGTAQQIRIRGASSINLSNEPLVFIDGVLADSRITVRGFAVGGQGTSRLNDLRPEDIESIEIVKGPAAATLYGADASVGVIQILTKRGQIGQDRFSQSITAEYTVIEPNFTPPDNVTPCTAAAIANPNVTLCQGRQVGDLVRDNPLIRDGVLKNGRYRSLSWSGRGGGQNYGYFVSLGADLDEGTLPNNASDRYSGRVNFNFTPHPRLQVEAGYSYVRNEIALPDNDNNGFGYMAALLGNPLTVGLANNGWFGPGRNGTTIGLLENENYVTRNLPTLTLRHLPTSWFNQRLTIGADLSRSEAESFVPKTEQVIFSARLAQGDITETVTNLDIYTFNYLGNMTGRFGGAEQFSADLSFGLQATSRRDEFVQANGNGLITNAARAVSAAAERTGTQQVFTDRTVGWLGQLQLGHHDRRYVQVGARLDKASSFGREAEWIFLPKVGGSWVVSDEPFWNLYAVSTLRLRGAYGATGRAPGSLDALERYAAAPYALTQTTVGGGVVPQNPGNPVLRAERGTEIEAGIDAGLFNERVGLELTYFNKTTKDLLLAVPLPPSLGFTQNPVRNIGEVVNRGVEVAVNARIIDAPNFMWEARVGANTLHNEITTLGGVEPFNVTTAFNRHSEGRQVGAFYSLKAREVITQPGDPRCPLSAGQRVPCVIVSDTIEFSGNPFPTFEGSVGSTLTLLRNIRLYGQLDWKRGHTLFNNTAFFRETQGFHGEGGRNPQFYPQEERLRRFGPFVRESGGGATTAEMREQYHQKADFARLREVAVTLELPQTVAARFGATNASLTLAGRNLALWSDYEGFDPEVISGVATSQWLRQDFLTIPPERRWVARVNFGF